jgi:hypothetical protein
MRIDNDAFRRQSMHVTTPAGCQHPRMFIVVQYGPASAAVLRHTHPHNTRHRRRSNKKAPAGHLSIRSDEHCERAEKFAKTGPDSASDHHPLTPDLAATNDIGSVVASQASLDTQIEDPLTGECGHRMSVQRRIRNTVLDDPNTMIVQASQFSTLMNHSDGVSIRRVHILTHQPAAEKLVGVTHDRLLLALA